MENDNRAEISRTFVSLPSFSSKWKSLGLTDEDLRKLELELLRNPKLGPVMRGTGGVRKMRYAFENRGKSGSARVIYVDFEVYEQIFFIDIFAKSTKENLSPAERNDIKQIIELIELELEKRARMR